MNETTKFETKSEYHSDPESNWTIKRILDTLKEDLQQEPIENDATKKFAEALTKFEEVYNGIPEIVSKFQEAHINYVGTMADDAKRKWDDIKSWSDDEVAPEIKTVIEELRQGDSYDKKEQVLENNLRKAWWEYHSLLSYYDYFTAKETQKADDFKKVKEFQATVDKWFTDLEKLHVQAKEYMEAKKHQSVFAVRLEYFEIWQRTLELSTVTTPDWLKKELTEKLRILIAAKHESYLWHNIQLKGKDAYQRAKENYDSFIKTRRESFIREAQDVEHPAEGTTS